MTKKQQISSMITMLFHSKDKVIDEIKLKTWVELLKKYDIGLLKIAIQDEIKSPENFLNIGRIIDNIPRIQKANEKPKGLSRRQLIIREALRGYSPQEAKENLKRKGILNDKYEVIGVHYEV